MSGHRPGDHISSWEPPPLQGSPTIKHLGGDGRETQTHTLLQRDPSAALQLNRRQPVRQGGRVRRRQTCRTGDCQACALLEARLPDAARTPHRQQQLSESERPEHTSK